MLHKINKKVSVFWVKHNSAFRKANPDMMKMMEEGTRCIGSAGGAVNTMLAAGEEQRAIMRHVLGVDPNSQTSNWDKELANYWHSLSKVVPETGLTLDIGYNYNIETNDTTLKKNIDDLIKKNKDITDSKALAEYVEKNIEEEYKYRYGLPNNPADYMLWRYCLVYGYVANTQKDIDKAPKKIKFYLYSEEEKRKARKERHDIKKKINKRYLEVIEDEKLMRNILIMANMPAAANFKKEDMEEAIDALSEQSPAKFLALSSDKHISTKAEIEDMINNNILKRLTNTSVITDAEDPTKKIGSNMEEALAYFSDDNKKSVVNEYRMRLKHSKKS